MFCFGVVSGATMCAFTVTVQVHRILSAAATSVGPVMTVQSTADATTTAHVALPLDSATIANTTLSDQRVIDVSQEATEILDQWPVVLI